MIAKIAMALVVLFGVAMVPAMASAKGCCSHGAGCCTSGGNCCNK